MTVSSTIAYTQNTNQIINGALRHLGVYGIGRTVSNEILDYCKDVLNDLVLEWSVMPHLWSEDEGYLFPDVNTAKFKIGSTAKAVSSSDAVITKLTANAAAAATSLSVSDTTGMTVGDNIGIVLTDTTIKWTTIATIPTSTSLTISAGLTSASASGNLVYTYTTAMNKPMVVDHVRRMSGFDSGTSTTLTESPLYIESRFDYLDSSNKTSNGTPTAVYIHANRDSQDLYFRPRPGDASMYYAFNYRRRLFEFDAGTNTGDFPVEWIPALKVALAIRLAPTFGKENKMQGLILLANNMLTDLMAFDSEMIHILLGVSGE